MTGAVYFIVAAILALAMLGYGIAMVRRPNDSRAARRLLFASLFYLPIVLLAMVVDRI